MRRRMVRHLHDSTDKRMIVEHRLAVETLAERAGSASSANAQIRGVVERLPHDDGHSLQFFCECGCGGSVLLTIAEYDALAGKPVRRSGHPG